MTITREQSEDRLAQAIRAYVESCGALRRAELEFFAATSSAGAHARGKAWQAAKRELYHSKRSLASIEKTFNANGGRLEALLARLEAAPLHAPRQAA
jgi:hypothetical protein